MIKYILILKLSVLGLIIVNKVRTVKAFVETLFYLTNNPDCIINKHQIEFFLNFIETIQIEELFDFSEAGISDRTDIVKVLVEYVVNINVI